MKPRISDDVLRALSESDRAPGWNNRSRDVRVFWIPGDYGRDCTLYVVPYRRWAYRRQERATADYWRAQGRAPEGTAA